MNGTISWQSSTGDEVRREFAHYDAPSDHAMTFRGDMDSLSDSMLYQSVERSLAARESYWDRLVEIVLARQGPRGYLCNANWDTTGLSAHWARAMRTDDMPTLGPAVAALFSNDTERVVSAASKVRHGESPYIVGYLERYMEISSDYINQMPQEYVQMYLDELATPK